MKNKFVFFLFISNLINFYSSNMISRQQLTDKKLENLLKNAKIVKSNRTKKRKRGLKSKNHKLLKMTELEKLGFKKGIEYEKKLKNTRKLKKGKKDDHSNLKKGALGLGALGLGTFFKKNKNKQMEEMKKMFKEQYVNKNAVISIIDQELQDLHFITAKLNSAARRIGSVESNITQRIQGKIFDLYETKN